MTVISMRQNSKSIAFNMDIASFAIAVFIHCRVCCSYVNNENAVWYKNVVYHK